MTDNEVSALRAAEDSREVGIVGIQARLESKLDCQCWEFLIGVPANSDRRADIDEALASIQSPPCKRSASTCRRHRRRPLIELPVRDPCDLCVACREEKWKIIDEGEHTLTVINPRQFEVGQCCVITRRHVATLLDLSDQECAATMVAAKRVAEALVKAYQPLGILTFQNNGVYSGQETPHFHFHVVPRQQGSDWGIGPPQLATFDGAGRKRGASHDPGEDAQRLQRVQVSARQLTETAALIRSNLPE